MNADSYLETQVLTAPPEQLHMMVVDGALRFARQGLTSLGESDYEMSHESFSRSREFVNELIVGLKKDEEQDQQIIDNLQSLFGFVHRALVAADGQRDEQKAKDAIKILEQHRETWAELIDRLKAERGDAAPTPHQMVSSETDGTTRSWVS